MFQRAAVALTAVALIGIVVTIYAVISSTPMFPKSLECPGTRDYPARRGPVLDDWTANWYSSELVPFSEQPIFQDKDRDKHVVRLLLNRSFDANVMVRTVETADGNIRLIAKWMPGNDGCDRTRTHCSIDRLLTNSERARLQTAQRPLLGKASYGCHSGVDGQMWIVESSGRGNYGFWSEWSPESGDLRELSLVMLALTGWHLQYI